MNTIERIGHWGDVHHPGWMDLFRIALGGVIFYKGIQFSSDIEGLRALMPHSNPILWTFFFSHYIPMAHIAGGILIAVGLITRWAVLFQIPVLIGAVVLNGKSVGMFHVYSEFWFSLLILGLLILFLIYGSGPFSVDEHMKKHPGG